MAACTIDNPSTYHRECWQDGRLLCSYSATLLLLAGPIPSSIFFFGADIGPWKTGQICGDISAMTNEGNNNNAD